MSPCKHWLARSLTVVLIVSQIGCGWKITPPPGPRMPVPAKRVADAVVLQVNDRGVLWGGGECGDIVRAKLLELGTFAEVHYPIEPRNPPPLRLEIEVTGDIDEEIGFGIIKSVITGLLLLIPVGLIRYNKDFDLAATVVLEESGRAKQTFQVSGATTVSHTLFSDTTGYEAEARRQAFGYLAEQIAAQLQP